MSTEGIPTNGPISFINLWFLLWTRFQVWARQKSLFYGLSEAWPCTMRRYNADRVAGKYNFKRKAEMNHFLLCMFYRCALLTSPANTVPNQPLLYNLWMAANSWRKTISFQSQFLLQCYTTNFNDKSRWSVKYMWWCMMLSGMKWLTEDIFKCILTSFWHTLGSLLKILMLTQWNIWRHFIV